MDLAPLRTQVREVQFAVHGVAATVTVPSGVAVATRVVWLTPVAEEVPAGADLRRSEPRRIMAIRRDDLPSVPIGTLIKVTEHLLDSPSEWAVDGTETIRSDHYRVVVVPFRG
jgi:hypothetical protein